MFVLQVGQVFNFFFLDWETKILKTDVFKPTKENEHKQRAELIAASKHIKGTGLFFNLKSLLNNV